MLRRLLLLLLLLRLLLWLLLWLLGLLLLLLRMPEGSGGRNGGRLQTGGLRKAVWQQALAHETLWQILRLLL